MSNYSINIKSRPIKLLFFVPPANSVYLKKTILINSFLWGGSFNPILPLYKRKPKFYDSLFTKTNYSQILNGYIKAYDPDFFVQDEQFFKPATKEKRKTVNISELVESIEKYRIPKYGVGLFEILKYLYKEEYKFKRKYPLKLIIPQFPTKYNLFLSSVFGNISTSTKEYLNRYFDEYLEIEYPTVTIENYLNYLSSDYLFLRRITNLTIDIFKPTPLESTTIFIIDATSINDIIDYWNLRALGFNVLPIPKQTINLRGVSEVVETTIQNEYDNKKNIPRVKFLKGRSISIHEMQTVTNSLLSNCKSELKGKYLLQNFFPRIWDDFGIEADNATCGDIRSEFRDEEVQSLDDYITIKSLDPKIELSNSGYLQFANDINIRVYSHSNETYAEIIPEGEYSLNYNLGFIGISDWRISRKGIVNYAYNGKSRISFKYPTSELVFIEWFKAQGWEVQLSDSGRIAKEMLKHLGSIWNISLLTHKGLIDLLEKMKDDKALHYNFVRDEVKKIIGKNAGGSSTQSFMKRIIDFKIIELCLQVKCNVCQQNSVFTINRLDYQIQCTRCLNEIILPTHNLSRIVWVYRAIGPFSLQKKSYGIYSVLLTLHFFSKVLDSATTPIFSFNAVKKQKNIEVDLALFIQKNLFNESKQSLVFVECKTFNNFTSKDINRMRFLIDNFPNCIIVFATLKSQLSLKEKNILLPFVKNTRKYWKNNIPRNPVLILTSNELFCHYRLNETYKNLGEPFNKYENQLRGLYILDALCDITQQIYLELPSWNNVLRKKFKLE